MYAWLTSLFLINLSYNYDYCNVTYYLNVELSLQFNILLIGQMASRLGITADLNSLTIKGDLKTIEDSWSKYSEQIESHKSGYTPLHEAARRGHSHIVDYLLKKGANVNALSVKQETALFYAAEGGHTDCEMLLLAHNADVHAGKLSPLSTTDAEFLDYLTSQGDWYIHV